MLWPSAIWPRALVDSAGDLVDAARVGDGLFDSRLGQLLLQRHEALHVLTASSAATAEAPSATKLRAVFRLRAARRSAVASEVLATVSSDSIAA